MIGENNASLWEAFFRGLLANKVAKTRNAFKKLLILRQKIVYNKVYRNSASFALHIYKRGIRL